MKRIAITLLIGIMLGYMLGLVHQLAQKTNSFQNGNSCEVVISKMENTTEED